MVRNQLANSLLNNSLSQKKSCPNDYLRQDFFCLVFYSLTTLIKLPVSLLNCNLVLVNGTDETTPN